LQMCDVAKEMMEAQRLQDAMELLGAALEIYSGADRFVILHNMSAYLLEDGRAVQALIYAKAALEIIPGNPQVLLLINRIERSTSS
jgi:tetratricopeptide (TPR) repeat protein